GRVRCFDEVALERVEVHDHEVEGPQAALDELRAAGVRPRGQDATQDARVERLDPAAEPGPDPGELLGRVHGDAGVLEMVAGSACGPQFDAELREAAAEIAKAGFIVDRKESAFDPDRWTRLGRHRPYPQWGGGRRDKFLGGRTRARDPSARQD